jgi:hypothetical protein
VQVGGDTITVGYMMTMRVGGGVVAARSHCGAKNLALSDAERPLKLLVRLPSSPI